MNIADNISKLRKSRHIEFSAISGYNYYYLPEEQQIENKIYSLHAQSYTIVYLVLLGTRSERLCQGDVEWHKKFILKPITSRDFEWTIDLFQCKTYDGKYWPYHVFSHRVVLAYVPLKKLLSQRRDSKVCDWRNKTLFRLYTVL